MLSKVESTQIKGEESFAVFPKVNKKMYRSHKPEIVLTNNTLDLQFLRRKDASVFKFLGKEEETSNGTLKMLMKAAKSLKQIRKVVIEADPQSSY